MNVILGDFWNQGVADFKYGKTVGQVLAYITAHPPSDTATVKASVQQLDSYLTSTCHINMSS